MKGESDDANTNGMYRIFKKEILHWVHDFGHF